MPSITCNPGTGGQAYHARLNRRRNANPRLRWLFLHPCFCDLRGFADGLEDLGAKMSTSSGVARAASISSFDSAGSPG